MEIQLKLVHQTQSQPHLQQQQRSILMPFTNEPAHQQQQLQVTQALKLTSQEHQNHTVLYIMIKGEVNFQVLMKLVTQKLTLTELILH